MPAHPDVLLTMTDPPRHDTLRCMEDPHLTTPHTDALTARGVACSHAVVQGAVCGPSRNSIVSAQYVHNSYREADAGHAWREMAERTLHWCGTTGARR